MENTTNLKLPLLIPNQSGKEITHNEALIIIDNILQNGVIDKDLITPPENPNTNDLYIVKNGASGEWSGKDYQLAFFDNGWRFIEPREGFTFWVNDENCLYSFDGSNWVISSTGDGATPSEGATSISQLDDVLLTSLQTNDILQYNGEKFINTQLNLGSGGESSGDFGTITNPTEFDIIQHNGVDFVNTKSIQNISMLGIGAGADENNKLSVKSDYILFDKLTTDSRVKVNKANEDNTSSHLFQNNYSGRAEFGLIGTDDFTLKVSPDGNTWNNAFVVDKTTGNVDFKGEITKNGNSLSSGSGGSGSNWINSYLLLSTITNVGTHSIDLSLYLPNDANQYEILLSWRGYTENPNVASRIFVSSDIITTNIILGWCYLATGTTGNSIVIPVGSNRYINYIIDGGNISIDTILYISGYKKIN